MLCLDIFTIASAPSAWLHIFGYLQGQRPAVATVFYHVSTTQLMRQVLSPTYLKRAACLLHLVVLRLARQEFAALASCGKQDSHCFTDEDSGFSSILCFLWNTGLRSMLVPYTKKEWMSEHWSFRFIFKFFRRSIWRMVCSWAKHIDCYCCHCLLTFCAPGELDCWRNDVNDRTAGKLPVAHYMRTVEQVRCTLCSTWQGQEGSRAGAHRPFAGWGRLEETWQMIRVAPPMPTTLAKVANRSAGGARRHSP